MGRPRGSKNKQLLSETAVEVLREKQPLPFSEMIVDRYIQHLENENIKLRDDHNKNLQDKDILIATLREEKAQLNAKIIVYENTVLPHSSKMGAEVIAYQKPAKTKPNFSFIEMPPTKSRWQAEQEAHEARILKEEQEEQAQKAATAAQKE